LPQCNNNLGQIVGFYPEAGFSSQYENFLLSLGVFEPIKGYPGAESTNVVGVNPRARWRKKLAGTIRFSLLSCSI